MLIWEKFRRGILLHIFHKSDRKMRERKFKENMCQILESLEKFKRSMTKF